MALVEALRSLFAVHPGNFIVRGSVGRGERNPQDVDMIVLVPNAETPFPESLPRSIHGLDISYVDFRTRDLPEYFTTRLRPGNDAFESIPIRISDPEIMRLFDAQREIFLRLHIPHYVLYLWLEDRIVQNHYSILPRILSGRYYKSVPGSKRSMLRYYWIARCLRGDFEHRDFVAVARDCEADAFLPEGFLRIYESISASVQRSKADSAFHAQSAAMLQWRDQRLEQLIRTFVTATVERDYTHLIQVLADGGSTPTMLSAAYDASERYHADRQWTLWFGLAAHRHTPRDVLLRIYHWCRGRAAFKDVVRNLVRNTAFPLESLDEELYGHDEDVQWFKFERQQIDNARN